MDCLKFIKTPIKLSLSYALTQLIADDNFKAKKKIISLSTGFYVFRFCGFQTLRRFSRIKIFYLFCRKLFQIKYPFVKRSRRNGSTFILVLRSCKNT